MQSGFPIFSFSSEFIFIYTNYYIYVKSSKTSFLLTIILHIKKIPR